MEGGEGAEGRGGAGGIFFSRTLFTKPATQTTEIYVFALCLGVISSLFFKLCYLNGIFSPGSLSIWTASGDRVALPNLN